MLAARKRSDAVLYHLPGRTWGLILGPDNAPVKNTTLGYAIYPPGSAPPSHTHDGEEEVVFVLSGKGTLNAPGEVVDLVPGVACCIPTGVEHWVVTAGDEPLEFITIFSPPSNPGITFGRADRAS
jgi:quercetin dioxygenase-like cupin family protein